MVSNAPGTRASEREEMALKHSVKRVDIVDVQMALPPICLCGHVVNATHFATVPPGTQQDPFHEMRHGPPPRLGTQTATSMSSTQEETKYHSHAVGVRTSEGSLGRWRK